MNRSEMDAAVSPRDRRTQIVSSCPPAGTRTVDVPGESMGTAPLPGVASGETAVAQGISPAATAIPAATTTWQEELKRAFRSPEALATYLRLPADWVASASTALGSFPLLVPRPYAQRMQPGDVHDPLLRQVWPWPQESDAVAGYSQDPVGELPQRMSPGVIQKYRGRALLVLSGACAVHCRYCFRRHFPYEETPSSPSQWQPQLQMLSADDSLRELILSGGDPLSLRDDSLAVLLDSIAKLPHLRRLRIHTRLPVVIPQRVTDSLLEMLQAFPRAVVCVVHLNHARELDESLAESLRKLRMAGVVLLNQAVLLKGVNDRVDTLVDLSERLIDCGIVPYYLHQLDRVAGAAHYEVPESTGRRLVAAMRAQLPGYAVPAYVRDEAGAPHKLSLE